jgi:hypothetical protein
VVTLLVAIICWERGMRSITARFISPGFRKETPD